MRSFVRAAMPFLAVVLAGGCQNPSDPNEEDDLDVITASVTPNPAVATGPTGRTYVVQRTDQPDEIREYDWQANFTVAATLTEDANDDSITLDLPIKLSAATVTVQQLSGGILTTPTGGESVRSEYDVLGSSSNQFSQVGNTVSVNMVVWYDLPNLRREARLTATIAFTDAEGRSFSESVEVDVAP